MAPMKAPKLSYAEMSELMQRADEAGHEAATATTPPTMLVGEPKDMMDSLMGGDGGGLDPDKDIHIVRDGPCGFAWVNVKPGTSRFARWLKETGRGKADSYYGGVTIWIRGYRQSYTLKQAHADAMARVLREAGIEAYAQGRLD